MLNVTTQLAILCRKLGMMGLMGRPGRRRCAVSEPPATTSTSPELLVETTPGRKRRPGFERLVDACATHGRRRRGPRRGATTSSGWSTSWRPAGRRCSPSPPGTRPLHRIGRMVARMLGAAAQHESERMGERKIRDPSQTSSPDEDDHHGGSTALRVESRLRGSSRPRRRRWLTWPTAPSPAPASSRRCPREMTSSGIRTAKGDRGTTPPSAASLVNPAVAGLRVHRREIVGPGELALALDGGGEGPCRTC